MNGALIVNGVAATSFTSTDLFAGRVYFRHDGSSTTTASFDIVTSDGAASSTTAQFNLTILPTPTNVSPAVIGDLTATVAEGGAYVLTTTDLGMEDLDGTGGGSFQVSGASGPNFGGSGQILVGGSAATSFTAGQLAAGQVSFLHGGAEGSFASFQVVANDGLASSAQRSFQFNVTPVNDAPSVTGDRTATVAEGGSYVLTFTDLFYADPDTYAWPGVAFSVSGLVAGQVLVNGAAVTSFTASQLYFSQVSFKHDGSDGAAAGFKVRRRMAWRSRPPFRSASR